MGYLKTAMLMAAMTALFMGLGYMLGGATGMLIALIFAAGTNAFAWWNSDKMVLRMHNAQPVIRGDRFGLHDLTADLVRRADMPMPAQISAAAASIRLIALPEPRAVLRILQRIAPAFTPRRVSAAASR